MPVKGAVDPNAGYGANTGAVDGSLSEEAALRAITTFYFEYDSSDLKPEAMRALDVHAKDLKAKRRSRCSGRQHRRTWYS